MTPDDPADDEPEDTSRRLHIGGRTRRPGWTCFDIKPGPGVDAVGDCRDLARYDEHSFDEVYASHVLEHLSARTEILPTLKEWRRVLLPGGVLKISVPDFEVLCRLFLRPDFNGAQRGEILRMVFGAQVDEHDFHKAGLTFELLREVLALAGFGSIARVDVLGPFADSSRMTFAGVPVSLNVVARRPLPGPVR